MIFRRQTALWAHLFFCIFVTVAFSEETQKDLDKTKSKTLGERARVKLQNIDEDSGFGPTIGTIESGSGIAGGIRYKHSLFQTSAAISTQFYQQYDFQIGLNAPRKGLFLRVLRYSNVYDIPEIGNGNEDQRGWLLYMDARYRSHEFRSWSRKGRFGA